jgi:WD40 repeat protein
VTRLVWQRRLDGQPTWLACVDGAVVAALGEGSVEVLRLEDGTTRLGFAAHEEGLLSASCSATHLATGGMDGFVRIWSWTGERRAETRIHGWVDHVAWARDGSAVGAAGRHLCVLDAQGLASTHRLDAGVVALATSTHEGSPLVALSTPGTLRLFIPADPSTVEEHRFGGTLRRLAFEPRGRAVVGGAQDATLRILRLRDRRLGMLGGYVRPPRHLAFSPDGELLATSGLDLLVVWRLPDASSDGAEPVLHSTRGQTVQHLAWRDDGARLACTTSEGSLFVIDRPDREPAEITHVALDGYPTGVTWAGGDLLVASTAVGSVLALAV